MNTTLQLVLPCMNDIKVLASIGGERISLTPDAPTVGELDPNLSLSLWNGLFVKKGTPQDVIDKLAEIASATMASDEAQELMAATGARVYWQGMDESATRIVTDRAKSAELDGIIGQ